MKKGSAMNGENRNAYVVNYDADMLQYHSLSTSINITSQTRVFQVYDSGEELFRENDDDCFDKTDFINARRN